MIETVSVPLTPEEQATLRAHAEAQGISLDALLRAAVLHILSAAPEVKTHMSAGEFDSIFEEIADMIPTSAPPLSDRALSRENLYTREDEWNR